MTRKTLLLLAGGLLMAACGTRTALTPTPLPAVEAPTLPATEAPPPTSVPTQGHLPFVDWLSYHDEVGGFTIQHPLTWQQVNNEGESPIFSLQAAPGTTLLEKYMQIDVTPDAAECRQLRYGGATASSHVTINGVEFLKETGAGLGAGNSYEWTGYSTQKSTTCITLIFVLHSANPAVYATEPPPFDAAAESAVFDEMLNTFQFD